MRHRLDDDRTVRRDVYFDNDLLVDLGCDVEEDGWAITDATGLTSVAGVWVAGNVANPRAQVITAAGEGSAAAIAINADLVTEDVSIALRAFTSNSRRQPAQERIPNNT